MHVFYCTRYFAANQKTLIIVLLLTSKNLLETEIYLTNSAGRVSNMLDHSLFVIVVINYSKFCFLSYESSISTKVYKTQPDNVNLRKIPTIQ